MSLSPPAPNTTITFEFVDSNGITVFSELADYEDVSGGATAYVWIKEDPLRTADSIADGPLSLYVVGTLDGVPEEFVDRKNLRSTFRFEVRKNFPNLSPIVFNSKSQPKLSNISRICYDSNFENAWVKFK